MFLEEALVWLEGKVAVVTGGTRGLGRAIADAYVAEGCRVMCAARDPGTVAEFIDARDGRVAFHPVDVRDPVSVRELMDATHQKFGRLDVLVANAGASRPGPAAEIDPKHWAEVIDTNVTGTFLCTRSAVPYLELDGGGRVITLSSALATRVAPGASAYAASKAAIEMFTRVTAVELAPRGITVNCLSPGFIDEGMGHELTQNERVWSHYRSKLALGRPGRGDEVASAAVFLAADAASYINGHVLEVNGGLGW